MIPPGTAADILAVMYAADPTPVHDGDLPGLIPDQARFKVYESLGALIALRHIEDWGRGYQLTAKGRAAAEAVVDAATRP